MTCGSLKAWQAPADTSERHRSQLVLESDGAFVVSENTRGRPFLGLDAAGPLTRRPERLHALTAPELAIAFSQGLDLGEGKPAGHAQRVCYIAAALADALGVDAPLRAGAYCGALLHDIGATLAGAEI